MGQKWRSLSFPSIPWSLISTRSTTFLIPLERVRRAMAPRAIRKSLPRCCHHVHQHLLLQIFCCFGLFYCDLLLCSRMKDRNFDMPYVMLRGKNFFVTYGWSLNNVCHVSAVLFYDAASIIIHLQSLRHSFISTRCICLKLAC